jgi:uncharacterized membrane protein
MKDFSIKQELKQGWNTWKENKKILLLATLFLFAVGAIPNPADSEVGKGVFEALLYIVTTFVGMGYLKAMLMLESGHKIEFGEMFRHAQYFWRYLFGSMLYGLLVTLGFVALVVPGIYFAIKYSFVPILILDRNLKIGEAFTQSGTLTDGVKWKLLGLSAACGLVALLGLLALGVGLLVATPVIYLASIGVYRRLSS